MGKRWPNHKPKPEYTCIQCGLLFTPRSHRSKNKPPLYCSYKCCIEHRRTRSEWYQEAVALYKGGMGVKRIGKRYGIKSTMFAAQLKVDGHFIPNRHKTIPRWNKGVKLPKRYSWACIERLIMRGYKAERAKEQRFDDCGHWINHPERLNFKARIKEKRHADLKTNYFISKRIRSRVKSVMSGRTKSAPTLRLIGCTVDQLRLHLQSKFKRGMNWNNYGKVWHIDHIQPCASFDLSNPDEQARCFHFSNLQPLRALDNRVKHDKIVACQPELILRF